MTVTVICIGDPHIKVHNIPEVELFVDRVEALILKKKPTFVCILGDILDTHERVHTLALNKAYDFIDRIRKISPVYVLVGNHDMCFGKDTPILLWSGNIMAVQNIQTGELLVGDDGTCRRVQSTCSGVSEMYLIKQSNGIDYTVTENHILTLKCGYHKSVFWDESESCWTVKYIDNANMNIKSKFFALKYRNPIKYTEYITRTSEEAKEAAEAFMSTIPNMDTVDIRVQDYLKIPKNVRERLYGFKTNGVHWPKQDISIDPYILGMWLGDGDKDGSGFASADIELIQEWWEWAYKNGAEIVHTDQYNFSIRNENRYIPANIQRLDICDQKNSCRTCKACSNNVKKYNRAPSLSCASIEELEMLIIGDTNIVSYFTRGASKEQLNVLNNTAIIQRVKKWKERVQNKGIILPETHHSTHLSAQLKKYNLHDNKHIPEEYLVNDEDIRLQLLAGFVDTGGYVDGHSIVITQGKNINLIDQLDVLVKSLGFTSYKSICINDSYGHSKKVLYVSGTIDRIPTRLPRKKCLPIMNDGIDSRGHNCADKLQTSISVVPIGIREYYGFSVDRNNRFLLGDFTVAHNCNNQQFLEPKGHWLNGMKEWDNTTIIDRVISVVVNDEKFIFIPYVPPGRFEEALETLGEEWEDASCIFAHQEFAGCKMGAITSVEGDKWPLTYPHVVSGHIHSRQIIQDNIYYPGAAMQHAFGESEKNIIACLTFKDGEYERDEVDLQLPRKKIIYKDVDDMEDFITPETDDKIKVTVSGNYEQFKALKKTKKYKCLLEKGVKVIFKPKKLERKKKELENPSSPNENDDTDFKSILHNIVNEHKNPYLTQAFEIVVNGNEIKRDDIMFI